MSAKIWGAALAALCWSASVTRAEAPQPCAAEINRHNVVECVLTRSAMLAAERERVAAAKGRERAVSPLLPSNPQLALSGGRRSIPADKATNWYGTLSQEVEIAGQRSVRRSAASSERTAVEQDLHAVTRNVSRDAWIAYFDAIAMGELLALSERIEQNFSRAAQAARAAAESGVAAGIEADVAEATALRLSRERIAAGQRATRALATLATLLGRDPFALPLAVQGQLSPLAHAISLKGANAERLGMGRPELLALDATRLALEQRTTIYRRSRFPNLTFSVFAQRDGFNERVLGGGVALPIPLPFPLGRTFSGEIDENTALARQVVRQREQAERELHLEVANALSALRAAESQQALFTSERLRRAEESLASIAAAISQGRLAILDGTVAQEALIELLRSGIEARLAVCVASVDLAHAAGLPLAGEGL